MCKARSTRIVAISNTANLDRFSMINIPQYRGTDVSCRKYVSLKYADHSRSHQENIQIESMKYDFAYRHQLFDYSIFVICHSR